MSSQAAIYLAQGYYQEAIALYEQAIAANPSEVGNYWHLGLVWLLQGEALEAQAVWLLGLSRGDPEQIDRWSLELIQWLEQQASRRCQIEPEAAERIYRQVLELDPERDAVYKSLGNLLYAQGRLEEAIACYQHVVTSNPLDSSAYNNLGVLFDLKGMSSEAIASYNQALALEPNALAHYNLGQLYAQEGRLAEAIACYRQAIIFKPDTTAAYHNLGVILAQQGQLEEAIALYQHVLTLEPHSSKAYNSLGFVLHQAGQFESALFCYDRALDLNSTDAETHWNRALLLLQLGDFKQGFAEFEWRWKLPETPLPDFSQSLWDGSNLKGRTLLLRAEHGFGDTIQFIRYAPLLAQEGFVRVHCPPELTRLFKTLPGIEGVSSEAVLPFDVQAALMSLPNLLGTTLATIPDQIPYLSAPERDVLNLQVPADTRLKVGIAWAGNPHYQHDESRSCSLSHFLPLLKIPGIAFQSLQKGSRAAEIASLLQAEGVEIEDWSDRLQDFADTAAVMAQLDLVITTDTAVAHLAGALGRPTWVLLSFVPEWRWLLNREDSPWYPGMRLFRQRQPGDWTEVFTRVVEALLSLEAQSFL